MRHIRLILGLLLVTVLYTSCIERVQKVNPQSNLIDEPKVIRDTVVRVIYDTVKVVEPVIPVEPVAPQPVQRTTSSVSRSSYTPEIEDYDGTNSGFFDQYRSSFQGDPNAGIQQTTVVKKVVKTEGPSEDEIERQKEAIARSLDLLEQRNAQEKLRYQQMEQERKAYNEQAIKDAKAAAAQQKTGSAQQTEAKTLDTNLLLNGRSK